MIKNNSIIILAGGFGTRLKSTIGAEIPKPLAPISGQPFLYYLVKQFMAEGITHFIFSLHFQSKKIINFIQSCQDFKNLNCKFFVEETPLGTGGGIKFALQQAAVKSDFIFVANGDTFSPGAIHELKNNNLFLKKNLLALTFTKNTGRFGSVSISNNNTVLNFNEKTASKNKVNIYTGIASLKTHDILEFSQSIFSLEQDYYPKLVEKKTLFGVSSQSPFIDIGVPEDYRNFSSWIK